MAASQSGLFSIQEFTDGGILLVGGRLYTYVFGTTTFKTAYTDAAGTIPHTYTADGLGGQYIALNARGELPAPLYLTTGSYDITLKRADNSTVWTRRADPVNDNTALADGTSATTGAGMIGFTYSLAYGVGTLGRWLKDLALSTGASFIGWLQAGTGAITRTVRDKLRERISAKDFGALGDGVTNDGPAIQLALSYLQTVSGGGVLWFPPGNYLINATCTIYAGTTIDSRGATFTANTGATPCFQTDVGASGITFLHAIGHPITGICSVFLSFRGVSATPSGASEADYARHFEVISLHVDSPNITTAILLDKATKSGTISFCKLLSVNGIISNGKSVEVSGFKNIIFGATGLAASRGIQFRSSGGTNYYSEGISFVDCTVDNHEIGHDVGDMFVYQVHGGYHSCAAALKATTGYAMQFVAPSTTTLTEDIEVIGGVLNARIRFGNSGSGISYHAEIATQFTGVPGTAIALENNACDIVVRSRFKGGTGTAVGVVGSGNNNDIWASGKVDTTYQNACVMNGAAGVRCLIGPWTGSTIGGIVGAGRTVRYVGVPVDSAGVAGLQRTYSASNLAGSYAVGVNIGSVAISFVRGEEGYLVGSLPYSGTTAATQNFQWVLPAGMVVASGTGWSAINQYIGATAGQAPLPTKYYCTADGSGNVQLLNQAGTTATINNQAWIGCERSW